MTADRGANDEDPIRAFGASAFVFPELGDSDPFADPGPSSVPAGVDGTGSSPIVDGTLRGAGVEAGAGVGAGGEIDVTGPSSGTGPALTPTDPADGTTRITRLDYGRHIRILLVDHDAEAAAAFIRAGEESVLDVRIEVTDGPESTFGRLERSVGQRPRKPPPDVVVTSIEVPEAHRLLEWLRHDTRFDDLPVLVLASSASPQDERRSFALGAAAHLVAPSGDYERVALVHALPDFIPRARAAHAHLESHRR